ELVEGDDAGVVQTGGHERLALRPRGRASAALALNDLHGHLALQPLVEGEPHGAESAAADPALQPVAIDHQLLVPAPRGQPPRGLVATQTPRRRLPGQAPRGLAPGAARLIGKTA